MGTKVDYVITGWNLHREGSSVPFVDPTKSMFIQRENDSTLKREFCLLCLEENYEKVPEFGNIKIDHKIPFSFNIEQDPDYNWKQLDDFDIKKFSYGGHELEEDPTKIESIKRTVNNGKYYTSKFWESFSLNPAYEGIRMVDTMRRYSNDKQPFNVTYNSKPCIVNHNFYIDTAIILIDQIYELRILIHSELKFGLTNEDKKNHSSSYLSNFEHYFWAKYYYITITNTRTNVSKKHSYLKEDKACFNEDNGGGIVF